MKQKHYRGFYFEDERNNEEWVDYWSDLNSLFGFALEEDLPNGVNPVGTWYFDNFESPMIFGKKPSGAITSAYIIEYSDGRFLVRNQGMNDTWIKHNKYFIFYDDLDSAIYDLKSRVEFHNYILYKRKIKEHVGFIIFMILLIIFYIWFLNFI